MLFNLEVIRFTAKRVSLWAQNLVLAFQSVDLLLILVQRLCTYLTIVIFARVCVCVCVCSFYTHMLFKWKSNVYYIVTYKHILELFFLSDLVLLFPQTVRFRLDEALQKRVFERDLVSQLIYLFIFLKVYVNCRVLSLKWAQITSNK